MLKNLFVTAYQNNVMQQLEGLDASPKIGMAKIAFPAIILGIIGQQFQFKQ